MARKPSKPKNTKIETITHDDETRPNIPTAEMENLVRDEEAKPVKVEYERKNNPDENPELYARNPDLDPQLVWKGKEEEDREPLNVDAVPIYVQERIHPKAIIDDIKRVAAKDQRENGEETVDLFADWDGELDPEDKIEFYEHAQKWTNRMILGDSLQVMTSLSKKEGLQGQVQCIYFDPPYGINFGSNWQSSVKSRIVSDGKKNFEAREPEVTSAFRDTWRNGINSYLSYMRDRLQVSRDLLTDSGSVFIQIGTENEHLLRSLLDEVFGADNFFSKIVFKKTLPLGSKGLPSIFDTILWYAKNKTAVKYRPLFQPKDLGAGTGYTWVRDGTLKKRKMTAVERRDLTTLESNSSPFFADNLMSSGYTETCFYDIEFDGKLFPRQKYSWKTNQSGMDRLKKADRLVAPASLPNYVRYFNDFPVQTIHNMWDDTHGASDIVYVVQTSNKVVQRCLLMASDPSDLVLDPTCGSGTTAYVAEKWGRRWITIDTSRVSLALARSRMVGSHFDYYFLNDSAEGAEKASVSGKTKLKENYGQNIREGFVYERVPHITLGAIANNTEIDTIWERWQETLEPLRAALNKAIGQSFEEWEIPREAEEAGLQTPSKRTKNGGRHVFPARRNRRIHRAQCRHRISLRPPLCAKWRCPRYRPVHGGKPITAPRRANRC